MTPLLGSDAYPGEWISAARAGATWVGEAWFDGIVLFATWSRAAAAAALPPDWRPAARASGPGGDHPLVVLVGRQRTTSVLFAGLTVPTDADYDEAMVAVPFTRHRAGRLLHTFVPLMYASDARALWSGNAHYGFAKRPGRVGRYGRTLAVTDEGGTLVMHAIVHDAPPWCAAADRSVADQVEALRQLGTMPVVGRRADGRDVVSYFDWSLEDAEVRPIAASFEVDAPLHPGLSPAEDPGGLRGLEVRGLRWRLSWPEACRP
jgi:hypothetical protein